MLSLIPWRKRATSIPVRHEPTSPYDVLARLRDDMDALVDRFFETPWFGDRMFGSLPSLWEESPLVWDWDQGWEDRSDEYVFRAELPGFEPSEFDVKVTGDTLSVRAEHRDEAKQNGGRSYRYGSFYRTFTLPHGVDEQKIDARYRNGVLEIHLPKTEEARGKRIEVKSA